MRKCFMFLAVCFCLLGTLRAETVLTNPERMTPLVGRNCVINQIDKDLVDVVGITTSLGNLVDTNIDNYVSLSGLAGVELAYHPILSVKDVEHRYGETGAVLKGIETGFVLQSVSDGTNLLTADVLKMFVIETYLDGEKQEGSVYDDEQSGLLDLNLITVATDGKTRVSIRTTKPFNEVRLAVAGVNIEAFKQLKLYYAYVGENEMRPITQTSNYPNASVHSHGTNGIGDAWTTSIWNWPNQKEKLVGVNSETDGVGFGTLSSLLTEPRVTIDAGEEIPANTEIGFMIENGSVLAINLLENTILTTYNANNEEVESKKIVSVLGLSALSGGKTTVSMVTTKPCRQIKIQFGGLNIDVGGTKIFYAYTRNANIEMDAVCDLKLSADLTVCEQSSVQLNGVAGITWSIVSQPIGANATVSSSGLVEGMTVGGEYIVQAQKGDCTDIVRINSSPVSQISSVCNRPIVGANVDIYRPAGGGCLLCLSPDYPDAGNVIDEDLTNYIEYTKGLDLLSNTSIYGVQRTDGGWYPASETNPIRVGFVMQATDQFLTADVLKFFVIKTYKGDVLQESSPIEQNDAVGANLIGGMNNLMRFSFVATKPFDKVTIWTAGVLSLNLSKYRIYYAFEEPANSDCMAQYISGSCLSLLSSQQGAAINYERTGFGGVANVGASMRNLSNLLDGDMNTYAFVNKTAGVAANTTLSIKANQIFEHGYQAGFIVEEQTWLGNVDLLRLLNIRTYLNGVETGDESVEPEVLSLDLIGSYGKSMVAITPTKPFDEIQLDMAGLVDALVELKVYGAFVQPDTDLDGISDCMDKNPCGEELVPSTTGVYCVGDTVRVTLFGGDPDGNYSLRIGDKSYPFIEGVVSFNAEVAGRFSCSIFKEDLEVYTDCPITIHPLETQWTGAVSNEWDEWDNWTEGVPYTCTNVIIPSVAELEGSHYPELKLDGEYYCNGIHFKPGAELVRQDLLHYEQAWVSVDFTPSENYMMSIPLTDVYSGDMFVPANSAGKDLRNPFNEEIIGGINKTNPFVACKVWDGAWINLTGNEVGDKKFKVGEPFIINARANVTFTDTARLEMLFGKADVRYLLYNSAGRPTKDSIDTPRENPGQFIFPHEKGQDLMDGFDVTLTVSEPSTVFAIANPFMCHLDVDSLLHENEGKNVLRIKINKDLENNPNSDFASCANLESGDKIAPCTSFFVELGSPATSLTFKFKPNMMTAGDYTAISRRIVPQTKASQMDDSNTGLANVKAYVRNGEARISANETITKVEVVSIIGQILSVKKPNSTECRVALGDGVNIVKVETENGVRNFKLVK